jgi:hypothetical protein
MLTVWKMVTPSSFFFMTALVGPLLQLGLVLRFLQVGEGAQALVLALQQEVKMW